MELTGENEVVAWFRDELLPEIIREGHLPAGGNPRIVNCNFEPTERFTDHFASSPYFLELTIDSDEGRKVLNLLVKFCSQDDNLLNQLHLGRQFRNEVTVYGQLMNEFRKFLAMNPKAPIDLIDRIVPECYFARYDEENPKKSLLVFANQRKLGYANAESKVFLDYDHCAMALKQLGRFHALSLAMKIGKFESLESIRESLTECRYFDDPKVREDCRVFNGICNQRGVDHLLSANPSKVPRDYLVRMKEMLSRPYELFARLVSPKEPLALICHGDYCRNNLLFRYDRGHVSDARIFDFQLTRYASPSIDLSFFIYLNTSQRIRDEHLDEFLRIYHSTLISTTAEILDLPEVEISDRYPFELFADDFAEHAVYGYCHVAFFLAAMSSDGNIDWEETAENRARFLASVGGDEISERIADVIWDFYKRGFYLS